MLVRRLRLGLAFLFFGTAACTLILDRSSEQCSNSGDCATFGPRAMCVSNVCVAPPETDSGIDRDVPDTSEPEVPDAGDEDADADAGETFGHPGCFRGTPTTNEELLNACTRAACVPFDNCARLGLCDGGLLGAIPPTGTPPPAAVTPDSGATQLCTDLAAAAGLQIVYVTGSSNFPPFLAIFTPVLAKSGFTVVWQTSNSCAGVDSQFNTYAPAALQTTNKQKMFERPGRTTLFYNANGTTTPCLIADEVVPDIGESDIYAQTCTANIGYDAIAAGGSNVGEYLGPTLPMYFITPKRSTQTVFSAEAGQAVFGRGGTPGAEAGVAEPMPYDDPAQFFIRASSTATNQIISRGILVEPTQWWGVDKNTAQTMAAQMLQVPQNLAEKTIGIISADFADSERDNIKTLAFQARGQSCGFWPDSTERTFDKQNVRDGHYPMWGPLHFFAKVPTNAAAGAFVSKFSVPRLDEELVVGMANGHVIPACAMKVARDTEMGPIRAAGIADRPYSCDCFFDKTANGVVDEAVCKTCTTALDCKDPARPACNYGYCEER
ncbi:MAG: hypothetical protein KIT84_21560 [Labilithrix sp.]|nr:hypothetical protein [Labilithrix sp.]MCW5813632.1 hypothetical protein [Labilithrix sp.]